MKSPYQIAAFSAQCLLGFVCPRALKSGHTWTPPIRHCTSARVLCAASRRVFWVILCVLCLTSLGFGQEQAADAHGGDRTAASLTGGTASSFTVIGSQADLINNTELHKGEPAESAQGVRDANYWVAEMDKIQKSRAPIQDELAEIQKKIQETDQPELRDKVNRTEQFLVEVNRLRAEASNYVKPEFAQTLDSVSYTHLSPSRRSPGRFSIAGTRAGRETGSVSLRAAQSVVFIGGIVPLDVFGICASGLFSLVGGLAGSRKPFSIRTRTAQRRPGVWQHRASCGLVPAQG